MRRVMALVALAALVAAQDAEFAVGVSKVKFIGKSPNFQIYPNLTQSNSTYLQLRFSKIEELDASGSAVQKHKITSLAAASPTYTAGTAVDPNGVNFSYVNMKLDATTFNGFDIACPGASGRRLLEEGAEQGRSLLAIPDPTVTVTVFFGAANDTKFRYGNNNITVARGGIKFNVQAYYWPFCAAANTLSMEIDILLKGDAAASPNIITGSDGSKTFAISLGNNTSSNITFPNYATNAIDGNRTINAAVDLTVAAGKSTIVLKLSNPTPDQLVFYDPVVTSSVNITTSPTGSGSGGSGSASSVRLAAWTLLASLLLAAFMLA